MTTRTTSAASAHALPAETITDRRTMLATAGAAAVLAAIGTPAAASPIDPDAALLALRIPYENTLALMDTLAVPHNQAEEAYFALRSIEPAGDNRALRKRSGLTAAERRYNLATRANLKVIDRIAATPALTLAGVTFKAEVSRRESNLEPALVASIMDDLEALTARI